MAASIKENLRNSEPKMIFRPNNDILKIMNGWRKCGMYCDIILQVNGESIAAHSAVLSASSQYFRELLKASEEQPWTHSQASPLVLNIILSIDDVPENSLLALKCLLDFLYLGALILNKDSVDYFREYCKIFQMDDILQLCDSVYSAVKADAVTSIPISSTSGVNPTQLSCETKISKSITQDVKKNVAGVYQCSTCDHRDKSKMKILHHVAKHTNGYLLCSKCNYKTNLMDKFLSHQTSHGAGCDADRDDIVSQKSYYFINDDQDVNQYKSMETENSSELEDVMVGVDPTISPGQGNRTHSVGAIIGEHKLEDTDDIEGQNDLREPSNLQDEPNLLDAAEMTEADSSQVRIQTGPEHSFESPKKKKNKCHVCGVHIASAGQLRKHLMSHNDVQRTRNPIVVVRVPNMCNFRACGYVASSAEELQVHKKQHKGPEPLFCHICDRRFKHARMLSRHVVTHTTKQQRSKLYNLACDVCHKTFISASALAKHERCHDPNAVASRCNWMKIDDPNMCNFRGCGFKTDNDQALRSHLKMHEGPRPHFCHICEARFPKPSALAAHMIKHQTDTPYQCEHCGAQFKYKVSFTVHVEAHKEEKKFLCETCGSSFGTKANLQKHVARIHSDVRIPCPYPGCSYAGLDSISIKLHYVVHTGEKKYECHFCKMRFSQDSACKRHIKRKHSGKSAGLQLLP